MSKQWVRHRCFDHVIHPDTETLIVGTFNPDSLVGGKPNKAQFFYGRGRNNLWRVLPEAFGEASLKGKCKADQLSFARTKFIDFADLISGIRGDRISAVKWNGANWVPALTIV